ncbi:MAG TPA: hypothetical protein VJN67_22640 [Stellaceae bacterium]|nr:hypothetical protein [Stellaceae bacterium]
MNTKYVPIFALAAVLISGLYTEASAASRDERREQTALQGSSVSLCQAIAAAEQKTGGKAYDAGVDGRRGNPRIIVETNGPKGIETVIVDAQNGKIVGGHAGGETD